MDRLTIALLIVGVIALLFAVCAFILAGRSDDKTIKNVEDNIADGDWPNVPRGFGRGLRHGSRERNPQGRFPPSGLRSSRGAGLYRRNPTTNEGE